MRQGVPDRLDPVRRARRAARAGRAAGRGAARRRASTEARLYGDDPDDGVGGDGAFFLLLDEPEVYGLPPDPVVTTRDLPAMWRRESRSPALRRARRRRGVLRRRRAGSARGRPPRAEGAATASRRVPLLLRPPDHQPADLGGARHRRLPVPRRPAGASSMLAAAADLTGRPGAGAGVARLGASVAISASLRRADPRPREAAALRQHAARVQADLADERRVVDPRRLRAAHLRRSGVGADGRAARRGGPRGRSGRPRSAPGVASYTAALVADTAVPAWHGGLPRASVRVRRLGSDRGRRPGTHRISDRGYVPIRRLAVAGACVELIAERLMERSLGMVAETLRSRFGRQKAARRQGAHRARGRRGRVRCRTLAAGGGSFRGRAHRRIALHAPRNLRSGHDVR